MKSFLLIDIHALVHRFFHALPPLSSTHGEPINAVYGLAKTFLRLETHLSDRPDYIAAALDRPEPLLRKKQFSDYKLHRPPAAPELVSQFKKVPELLQKFGIPSFSSPGFEADDVLGTLVEHFRKTSDIQLVILSGDRDLLQLVSGKTVVAELIKNGTSETQRYDEAAVLGKYGLLPDRLPDFKGLVGDTSDNIPGVKGIGEKTAVELLAEFKTIEEVFENLPIITPSVMKKLEGKREIALLSRELATIRRDVPLSLPPLSDFHWQTPGREELKAYFRELGFYSLVD